MVIERCLVAYIWRRRIRKLKEFKKKAKKGFAKQKEKRALLPNEIHEIISDMSTPSGGGGKKGGKKKGGGGGGGEAAAGGRRACGRRAGRWAPSSCRSSRGQQRGRRTAAAAAGCRRWRG